MRVSAAVAAAGVLLLAATQLLPLVRIQQSLSGTGPISPYGSNDYGISGYPIPSVAPGARINISVWDISPGPVFVGLFPGSGVATGPPVYSTQSPGTPIDVSVPSPIDQGYLVLVTTLNRTTYRLRVTSIWSPFSWLPTYTVESVPLLLAGAGGYFYFKERMRREKIEEEVMARFPDYNKRKQ